MKYCVQNTRDASIVSVFEQPKKLKNWLKGRAKEQLEAHPTNQVYIQAYQHLRDVLSRLDWINGLHSLYKVNIDLSILHLPFHVSTYGE